MRHLSELSTAAATVAWGSAVRPGNPLGRFVFGAILVVLVPNATANAVDLPPLDLRFPRGLVTVLTTPPIADLSGDDDQTVGVDAVLHKVQCTIMNLGQRPVDFAVSFHGDVGFSGQPPDRRGPFTLSAGEYMIVTDVTPFLGGEYCRVELAPLLDKDSVRITIQSLFETRDGERRVVVPGPAFEGR
jgi:hypothetical protein